MDLAVGRRGPLAARAPEVHVVMLVVTHPRLAPKPGQPADQRITPRRHRQPGKELGSEDDALDLEAVPRRRLRQRRQVDGDGGEVDGASGGAATPISFPHPIQPPPSVAAASTIIV